MLLRRDLRRHQLDGLPFRRQHHDGASRVAADERRGLWPAGRGVQVLRFPAADVLSDQARIDLLACVAAAAPSVLRTAP